MLCPGLFAGCSRRQGLPGGDSFRRQPLQGTGIAFDSVSDRRFSSPHYFSRLPPISVVTSPAREVERERRLLRCERMRQASELMLIGQKDYRHGHGDDRANVGARRRASTRIWCSIADTGGAARITAHLPLRSLFSNRNRRGRLRQLELSLKNQGTTWAQNPGSLVGFSRGEGQEAHWNQRELGPNLWAHTQRSVVQIPPQPSWTGSPEASTSSVAHSPLSSLSTKNLTSLIRERLPGSHNILSGEKRSPSLSRFYANNEQTPVSSLPARNIPTNNLSVLTPDSRMLE